MAPRQEQTKWLVDLHATFCMDPIWASSREEAEAMAEEMYVNGELGIPDNHEFDIVPEGGWDL